MFEDNRQEGALDCRVRISYKDRELKMSGSGLSMADKDVTAQGRKTKELQSRTRELFGVENADALKGLP